jgi:hypothetical protein
MLSGPGRSEIGIKPVTAAAIAPKDIFLTCAVSTFASPACQFVKPGSGLEYAWLSATEVAVTMTLRVYGV